MTGATIGLLILFFALLLLVTKPLGLYMARVFAGERTPLSRALAPVEGLIYRACGIDPEEEHHWTRYALGIVLFGIGGVFFLFLILRFQGSLPLNPQDADGLAPHLAFNTAISFITHTNWQSYAGEQTMSHLSQMAGLTVQNFCAAAVGMALAMAFIRGLSRRSAQGVGNCWVDITRAVLYVLLPLSAILAIIFIWQGIPQSFHGPLDVTTLEGGRQAIAQGPVASQEAIKTIGTNGGGFFNANSAHPFENPNHWTNLLQLIAMAAIPSAMTYTFGRFVGDTRQGWAIWAVMAILLIAGTAFSTVTEQQGNPNFDALAVEQTSGQDQAGGNFEGKETRFGVGQSLLFTNVSVATSTGAANNAHDSLMPLAGIVPMVYMQTGGAVFGGAGVGLYSMLIFAILAVFIAGLMVGRTPEYLGKKIEPFEIKMVMLATLSIAASVLLFTALAATADRGVAAVLNPGPHGFSEILYAYSSGASNNGSAFGGLNANSSFYSYTLGLVMLLGRFLVAISILALAGSMARKERVPQSLGTLPTHGPLFVALVAGVVIIVGALTFFPALTLGPIVEHLML
jgi:K+-transporting ATPase ATPase A chain